MIGREPAQRRVLHGILGLDQTAEDAIGNPGQAGSRGFEQGNGIGVLGHLGSFVSLLTIGGARL